MRKRVRIIQPPTPESLAKAAFTHLGRYAASEAGLRRVLQNRLRRAALVNREFAADKDRQAALRAVIETIIERHKKTGVLNDAAYAETKVNSLRRVGRSGRAIRQKLAYAGVGKIVIENALAEDALDDENAEMKAALALARRRKLGSFRTKPGVPEQHRKDLAMLARAGFSLDVARRALGGQGLTHGEDGDDVELSSIG